MNNLRLELSIDDTNLILEALGNLPFARVFQLIGRVQEQARAQVEAAQQQLEGRGGKNE